MAIRLPLIECGVHGKRRPWFAVCVHVSDLGAAIAFSNDYEILCAECVKQNPVPEDLLFPVCVECVEGRWPQVIAMQKVGETPRTEVSPLNSQNDEGQSASNGSEGEKIR